MGFSGGGSNILKPHTHNGLTVQDGGALDFDDITQSQSSAGMVFYSDGTHLQQLAYPGVPAGQTLTAAGASTAPSWGSGGGGWTMDGSDSGDKGALTVASMTGRDVTVVYFQVEPSTAVTAAYGILQVNGVATSTYDTVNYRVYGGAAGTTTVDRTGTGYILEEDNGNNSELIYSGKMIIWKGNPALGFTGNTMSNSTGTYRNDINLVANTVMGSGAQPDTNPITQIDVRMTSGNISGKIQVMSMDYS